MIQVNSRVTEYEVNAMFPDRWSPRSFKSDSLTTGQIHALFEAARWSPSCFNDQPWKFIYAAEPETRMQFTNLLTPKNQVWAGKAPLLIFLVSRLHFEHNNKSNRHSGFDAGAAWMALSLQARNLGLYAHAMAGFNRGQAHDLLGLSEEEFQILAAIAVGYRDDAASLPEDLQEIEKPNSRKGFSDIVQAFRSTPSV